MNSCSESTKLADVMTTDPESDDESVPVNTPSSHFPHTPNTSRSICFELSSAIVCTLCCVLIACDTCDYFKFLTAYSIIVAHCYSALNHLLCQIIYRLSVLQAPLYLRTLWCYVSV